MALNVDLHSHSSRSDGVLPPAQVAARAYAQGVDWWSLSDHDETSGLAEFYRTDKDGAVTDDAIRAEAAATCDRDASMPSASSPPRRLPAPPLFHDRNGPSLTGEPGKKPLTLLAMPPIASPMAAIFDLMPSMSP